MASPLSRVLHWVLRKVFAFVRIDAAAVERVRALGAAGAVVYVMRHRSWLDYLLVADVLAREGLPVPVFVNDLSPLWFRPLPEVLVNVWRWIRGGELFAREVREFEGRARCRQLVAAGQPVLLFMRGRFTGVRRFRRRAALAGLRSGSDYLREILHDQWTAERPIALVPVAVFRGRGMRHKDSRLRALVYSVHEMPTELWRMVSLLWNARETAISVGAEVRLRDYLRDYRHEGEERLLRRIARALQIFLYQEERQVWGPPLLRKRQVRQRVLADAALTAVVVRLAAERRQSEAQVWREAERDFDEMAADFRGLYFSILEFLFNRVWPRIFQGLECSGLEKVAECVKHHPVVLVPCHRSHFDYLILSYIFHRNYLSPPHIAGGINLSFWPLGPLFRGAGAFFIRRSFDGDALYKAVFRTYLTFLIREGYTTEFFIEGGRSRTGKILTPKLGMLSAIVDAFVEGVRRDLYLVPVSIQYGRVVEQDAYQRELGGGEKERESLGALLRARRVLRRRHGSVYVTFAEPISLNETLGSARARYRVPDDDAVREEKRRFVQKLGFRLLREVNAVTVPGATAVSATVLLSHDHPGCRRREFVARAMALTAFLRTRHDRVTASLERNAQGEFRESLGFLEHGGLIQCLASDEEDVIFVPPNRRLALDFYKNNTIHCFLVPALLVDAMLRGVPGAAALEDVRWWLDLFRWEFPLPERPTLPGEVERLIDWMRRESVVSTGPAGDSVATDHPFVAVMRGVLDNFREAYWIACQVLASVPAAGMSRKVLLEAMRQRYVTGLLLGEVHKAEGNSTVTLGNALSRFAEIGGVAIRPGKGRDVLVLPGERRNELPAVARRIADRLPGR